MKIELHSMRCTCRGGVWALGEGSLSSPCPGGVGVETVVLTLAEWQSQGKPTSLERFRRAAARGEFPRYEGTLSRP